MSTMLGATASMDSWSYIVAAWIVVVAALVVYAVGVVRRARSIAERVPADRRRWMSTSSSPPDAVDVEGAR